MRAKDAGIYRCEIRGAQKYQDFQVVVFGKALINLIGFDYL